MSLELIRQRGNALQLEEPHERPVFELTRLLAAPTHIGPMQGEREALLKDAGQVAPLTVARQLTFSSP